MFNFGSKDPVVGMAGITIERPSAEVFKFIGVDFFQNYPKWSPEVIQLEALTEAPSAWAPWPDRCGLTRATARNPGFASPCSSPTTVWSLPGLPILIVVPMN